MMMMMMMMMMMIMMMVMMMMMMMMMMVMVMMVVMMMMSRIYGSVEALEGEERLQRNRRFRVEDSEDNQVHDDQLYMAVLLWYLVKRNVQCTILWRTLVSLFKRYDEENTAMFIWSGCISNKKIQTIIHNKIPNMYAQYIWFTSLNAMLTLPKPTSPSHLDCTLWNSL